MYRLEIFTDQMEYASATVVSKSQNIELDYLAYDAFSIETQLIEAKKGYFVHITQDNEFVADGVISDVRPKKTTQEISIRPIQAMFDTEIFYSPISSAIQWIKDTITAYFVSNSDAIQNRPIDVTAPEPFNELPLIENFEDVGDTVNLLSVIEVALKTYSIVVDTYLDMETLRIKCNIKQETATKTLEADLENVLESDITLGDSYGSINKAVVRKFYYEEHTSGGKTTRDIVIPENSDFQFYRLSDDTIVKSTDSFSPNLRIFPVFWDLIMLEKTSEMTDAKWLQEALAQAKEVLNPQTYDQEIVLKYNKDDMLVRPMELKIGTVVTVYLKGTAYTSLLAAKRIEGNVVTLTLGAVRTDLTKKLSIDKVGTGGSGGGGGGSGSGGGVPGPQGPAGVGIASVEQTTSTSASGGRNVVTVTKTDGTSSTFDVYNGQQGAQGYAAGFGTPSTSVSTLSPGTSATAVVTAIESSPNTAKIFNFAFGIPQGAKGDTGATGPAAGFAAPTASAITLSAGTSATASVSASGADTMKQFAFTFGIPQGAKGDTGPAGSSIQSIARTSGTGESGTTDTYTITLTNGNTSTFQVKNGNDGVGITMREVTLTTSGWSNNSQTVNVNASVSDATDYLSIPDAATFGDYSGSNVQLSSVTPHEGNVDLTFTCGSVPPSNVKTVVLISTSVQIVEEYLNGLVRQAEEAMAHQPQIQNGVWYVWNVENEQYESTGVNATGPQGPSGTSAGFGTPTASATTLAAGSSATASVTASGSNTSKVFAFNFGIPKGDKGDTGTAAGFGTPTASATALAAGAAPTASVTASGGNTAKVFAFNFGIPKGDKGDTGTAAGFGTPTASATTLSAGSSATASVTASGGNTVKVFNFAFGIPKGDKGDQGDPGTAAGFGTPTASVSTLSAGSNATVSVTASGGNTAKVFNFAFGIPKGDKGDTGTAAGFGTPTASATTLSAGASATASVTASGGNTSKVFNFSFGIPKGDTGATGASIQSITRTSGSGQPGETDTYTITLTNGNTSTFQVKNGNDGTGAVIRQATLTSNGWSNNSQTVTVSATTSDATDYLAIPDLSTASEYSGAGVTLSSVTRGEGTVALTFTCTSVPSSTVYADVIITTANDDISDYLNGVVNNMTALYNQTEADFNTASGLYVKKAGDTMTGVLTMKGNMYNDARDGALNMNNSDIYGANSIYTADKSDGAAEGIHFYRDATHVDSLWIADGAINFVPNRTLGTNTTAANSEKVARFTSTPTTGKAVVTDGTTGGLIVTDSVPAAVKATQNASGENIDSTYIRYNDRLFTTDPFAPSKLKSLYISKIDNSFYAADKRYNISGTNGSNALTAGEIASLFDGNYDSQTIKIQNGNTLTLTIDFSNLSDSKYPGYPYGDLILSFYYVTKPASITGRVYNNYSSQGVGWKDLTFTAIANENASQIWKAYNSYYGLQTIEITIVGDTTNSYGYTSPVQLEFRLDRPAPNRTPVVSKYIPETLYYDLTAPHFIGALTGNASTATKLATGRTIQTNLGLTTAATFDGSANVTPGITGTLGVANGGTGQTSAINASNALLNALTTGSSTPIDADYYISQYVGGGSTTTTYHRRPMSALWEYIKGKISSILGLTASNYGGNAASATADASGNNIKSTYLNGGSITVTPSTTTVNSITAVGSLPSLSFTPNSTTKTLAVAWSAGTLPTKGSNTTVATGISSATFTGTHPS